MEIRIHGIKNQFVVCGFGRMGKIICQQLFKNKEKFVIIDNSREKVKMAIQSDFEIIFCFGEKISHRKAGKHFEIVENQLKVPLFNLKLEEWEKINLAYEPIWAIGTGETASPDQVQEMHSFIRRLIIKNYNIDLADRVSLIYGGSVKSSNAKEIFSQKDVDGGLIGGASLDFQEFVKIIESI